MDKQPIENYNNNELTGSNPLEVDEKRGQPLDQSSLNEILTKRTAVPSYMYEDLMNLANGGDLNGMREKNFPGVEDSYFESILHDALGYPRTSENEDLSNTASTTRQRMVTHFKNIFKKKENKKKKFKSWEELLAVSNGAQKESTEENKIVDITDLIEVAKNISDFTRALSNKKYFKPNTIKFDFSFDLAEKIISFLRGVDLDKHEIVVMVKSQGDKEMVSSGVGPSIASKIRIELGN